MLFVSLSHFPRIDDIREADGIELRLDLFAHIDIEHIRAFVRHSTQPVLLTLRKKMQGGLFAGSEEERERLIMQLLDIEPPFFDLEYDMRPEFLHQVIEKYPKTALILSYHNFEKTPSDLDALYFSMTRYRVFGYKIAALALSSSDALRMLLFTKCHAQVSVVCMGEKGEFARVLGPVMGNLIDYAALDEKGVTGPGQLTLQELHGVYRYPFLNAETDIFGLIGNPVVQSIGHLYHNAIFHNCGMNAVYVKMAVDPEELSDFIPLAKKIGIRGLSVTSPLKQHVLFYLDEIGKEIERIGAVNTLVLQDGKLRGINTDGIGALDALEKHLLVQGKKLIVLGAGGAACAVAFEAHARGAVVTIVNRTVHKAHTLAERVGCRASGLKWMPKEYDILVNCSKYDHSIDEDAIRSESIVMDINYVPRETDFLKIAKRKGCRIVYGEEMFVNQAEGQTRAWKDG